MSHNHTAAELRDDLIFMLLERMGSEFCPACAAQALINALSRVMSSTIRQGDPEAAALLSQQVACHLETMAGRYRQNQPTETEATAGSKH